MFPDIVIIEDQKRREREHAWEPIPLHAPSPLPRRRENIERRRQDTDSSGTVIIIDISDYSETER